MPNFSPSAFENFLASLEDPLESLQALLGPIVSTNPRGISLITICNEILKPRGQIVTVAHARISNNPVTLAALPAEHAGGGRKGRTYEAKYRKYKSRYLRLKKLKV